MRLQSLGILLAVLLCAAPAGAVVCSETGERILNVTNQADDSDTRVTVDLPKGRDWRAFLLRLYVVGVTATSPTLRIQAYLLDPDGNVVEDNFTQGALQNPPTNDSSSYELVYSTDLPALATNLLSNLNQREVGMVPMQFVIEGAVTGTISNLSYWISCMPML